MCSMASNAKEEELVAELIGDRTRHAARTPSPQQPPARAQLRRRRRSRERWLLRTEQLVLVALGLGIMTVLNLTKGDLVMPRPDKVVVAGAKMFADGTMWKALGQSVQVFGIGYGVSALSGVVLGILIGGFARLGRVLDPFINALNSTPRVAFIPIIIVWFGLDSEAKIIVVWLSAVIPIIINTASGIEGADEDLVEMARAAGANRWQQFHRVLVPCAVPVILTGLRVGAALAILGTVVSELYTAEAGLGGLLIESSNHFEMAKYFAVVFVLMVIGVAVAAVLRAVERHFLTWRTVRRDGS